MNKTYPLPIKNYLITILNGMHVYYSTDKKINKSTTVAQVEPNLYYVLNQDWKNRNAENWILEKVEF